MMAVSCGRFGGGEKDIDMAGMPVMLNPVAEEIHLKKHCLNLRKRQRLLISLLLLATGLAPVLVGQITADTEPVDESGYICLKDIGDFEAIFLEHQLDFLRIVPPSVDFILVQPYRAPLFFDSEGFSKTFSDNLIGEFTPAGIPEYEVRVYEDPTTREIKFLNDANQLLEALAAPVDYNPYSHVASFYPALYTSFYSDTERDWLKALYDPSRVQGVFRLIPLGYAVKYEEAKKKQRLLSKPGRIKDETIVRRSSGSSNELWLAISNKFDGGSVEISINVPTSIQTNHLEIYTTEDLLTFWWDIAASNLVAGFGTNMITWTHDVSAIANKTVSYYTAGNADVDSDGDDLADTHERFIYHTDSEVPDTDGDLLPDGWEVLAFLDPLSSLGINGTLGDADEDGLSNLEEWTVGTDPNAFDTVIVLGPDDLYEAGGAKMTGLMPGVLYRSISTQRSKCGLPEYIPADPPAYYKERVLTEIGLRFDGWRSSDIGCTNLLLASYSRSELSVFDPIDYGVDITCGGFAELHWTNNMMVPPGITSCASYSVTCDSYGYWNSDCSHTTNGDLECDPFAFSGEEFDTTNIIIEPLVYAQYYYEFAGDPGGAEGGRMTQRERIEELSEEYTTSELLDNAMADLSACTAMTELPWGHGVYSVFPAGYSCSTGSAATAACRNLSTNEYQINLTRLGCCFQVTNLVPDQVYRLNWVEYFTPEGDGTGVVQNIRTDIIRGNGLLQLIAENSGIIEPPDEDGMIEPVVFKVRLNVDSDYDGDIDENDEGLKVSSGGVVAFNQDDDNTNGVPDWEESGLVSGEDDLRIIDIESVVGDLDGGTLILEAVNGEDRVKVWESFTNALPLDLPKSWDIKSDIIPTNLYIEGVQESTNWKDVKVRLRFTANGNNSDDYISMTVVGVDLDVDSDYDGDIDGDDDPIELSAGGVIVVNQDDDNGNGIPDWEESSSIAREDDLRPIHIKLNPPDLSMGLLKIEAVSGGSKIKLWEGSNKVHATILPKEWTNGVSAIPTNLYIEGLAASDSLRDVELRISWTLGTNKFSDNVKLTVLKVELTNMTFGMGWNLVPDPGGTYPTPHWAATNSSPYLYERSTWINATAMFKVEPSSYTGNLTLSGDGPGDLDFTNTTVAVSGGLATYPATDSTGTLTNYVDFWNPMQINWKYGIGRAATADAGQTSNKVYVALANPAAVPTLYHTVVHLACSVGHATNEPQAVSNSWSQLTGHNFTTWDGRTLYYYRDGAGWSSPGQVSQLLSTSNANCVAWRNLLRYALAVNGVGSDYVCVQATGPTNEFFVVGDWTFGTATFTNTLPYNWRLQFATNGPPHDMVPRPPSDVYGDLTSLIAIEGQNTAPPSEKVFGNHRMVRYGGIYYDPSYGVTHAGISNFVDAAVDGYAYRRVGDPTTNYVLRVKAATGVYEIGEWINDPAVDWTDGLP